MSATATEAQPLVEPPSASEAAAPVAAPSTAPQAPATPQAGKKGKGKESKSKDAKGKGKEGKGKKSAVAEDSGAPSVAAHPRAARAVAQAKGWGGLAGFFIAGYLSLPTGTLAQTGLRALIAGSVCYVAAWAGAVFVWQRLVIVEIKGREQALLAGVQVALGPAEPAGTSDERARALAASPGSPGRGEAAAQGR
ncbi:MAG TPA: hypothetical protein VHY18_06760 [Solirubrobacteraceae bacterium]|jgi:hypothetical protein|nr:hypothetical protein [Solirubrobacteraceae bacterium]